MKGVLLINLGSPDSTSVRDVRRFLGKFLMDGRVIDFPWLLRGLIVYGCILPTRPKHSAEAYKKIWTPEGSPLIAMSREIQQALAKRVPVPVELAMRYRKPSVQDALTNLLRLGVDELFVIPLFPHYAMSSYETAVEHVRQQSQKFAPAMRLKIAAPYFDDPDYIAALVGSASEMLENGYDHLLFSFHGLPERHLRKADKGGCHCLVSNNCCDVLNPAHKTCYRAQCLATVRAFVRAASIPAEKSSISFQSRLGSEPWMRPYTDHEMKRLTNEGVKKLLVICPAFVADCLETLEEMAIRGREIFLAAGGEEFTLIPCLNNHPLWQDTLSRMIEREFGKAEQQRPWEMTFAALDA